MLEHLAAFEDPADIVVESMLYTLEGLARERQLTLVLAGGHEREFLEGIASPTAVGFARAVLSRLTIDWDALGMGDEELDELAELALRLIQSFLMTASEPPRTRAEQRRFLHRWLGPALTARHGSEAMGCPR